MPILALSLHARCLANSHSPHSLASPLAHVQVPVSDRHASWLVKLSRGGACAARGVKSAPGHLNVRAARRPKEDGARGADEEVDVLTNEHLTAYSDSEDELGFLPAVPIKAPDVDLKASGRVETTNDKTERHNQDIFARVEACAKRAKAQ